MTTVKESAAGVRLPFLLSAEDAAVEFTREDISKAQQMIGQVAEEFMRREVLPLSEKIYAKEWEVSKELLRKAGELDLLRVDIPEAYGGLGLDKVSSAYVGEFISLMPSFGATLGAHTTIGTLPTVFFGNEDQRSRYLPKLASGEWIAAYCLTEAESGSDALAAKARAVLSEDGKHYILNGRKMWITNGGLADLFTVFAKVDGEKFTAFLVERSMGVSSAPEEKKLGLDGSSTTAIVLENCKVPVENVLGEIGKGHVVAFNVLNLGRLKLGSRNLGQAKNAMNGALEYSRGRRQFNHAISDFGLIRRKLAEMAIRCYVGDAMVWRTIGKVDEHLEAVDASIPMQVLKTIEQFAVECSIIKVWTSEALAYVVDEAVQIHGGYGFSREYPAERAYRDARITRIYEGTNEINRMIIPNRLLKGLGGERISSTAASSLPVASWSEALAPAGSAAHSLKIAAVECLQLASNSFGDSLTQEQEVLGLLADLVIDAYAAESACLRTEKLIRRLGPEKAVVQLAMTEAYISDASYRCLQGISQIEAVTGGTVSPFLPFRSDGVASRRLIAETMIEAGRYTW